MPLIELEVHPYLNVQIDFKNNVNLHESLNKYRILICGTFPIYAITESAPKDDEGKKIKAAWTHDAFIRFFYGSKGNHFWELISNAYRKDVPKTVEEAIILLNDHNILITDIIHTTHRHGYSPEDSNLKESTPNLDIQTILNSAENLTSILFTSKMAKKWFFDSIKIPNNRKITCIVLPTPSGNGRSVTHYFEYFPLNEIELQLRSKKEPYAIHYRERYYKHFLNL